MTFDWPQQHLPETGRERERLGTGLRKLKLKWYFHCELVIICNLSSIGSVAWNSILKVSAAVDLAYLLLFFGISHDTRRVSRNFIMNISWKYHEQQLSQQWAMNSKSLLSDLSTIECSIWWKINKLIPFLNCNYFSHKSNFYLVYYCYLLCDFRNFLLKTHCESSHKNS